jgi:hypothetical protein
MGVYREKDNQARHEMYYNILTPFSDTPVYMSTYSVVLFHEEQLIKLKHLMHDKFLLKGPADYINQMKERLCQKPMPFEMYVRDNTQIIFPDLSHDVIVFLGKMFQEIIDAPCLSVCMKIENEKTMINGGDFHLLDFMDVGYFSNYVIKGLSAYFMGMYVRASRGAHHDSIIHLILTYELFHLSIDVKDMLDMYPVYNEMFSEEVYTIIETLPVENKEYLEETWDATQTLNLQKCHVDHNKMIGYDTDWSPYALLKSLSCLLDFFPEYRVIPSHMGSIHFDIHG